MAARFRGFAAKPKKRARGIADFLRHISFGIWEIFWKSRITRHSFFRLYTDEGADPWTLPYKIFRVVFMQYIQSACKLLLQFMRDSLQAPFLFWQKPEAQSNP